MNKSYVLQCAKLVDCFQVAGYKQWNCCQRSVRKTFILFDRLWFFICAALTWSIPFMSFTPASHVSFLGLLLNCKDVCFWHIFFNSYNLFLLLKPAHIEIGTVVLTVIYIFKTGATISVITWLQQPRRRPRRSSTVPLMCIWTQQSTSVDQKRNKKVNIFTVSFSFFGQG